MLRYNVMRVAHLLSYNTTSRRFEAKKRQGQFKSPGQGARGQFGRQAFHSQQNYNYPQGNYAGHPAERRMSSAGSEGDSFLQGPGDESYDYQQLASDDSRDTQQGPSELNQGFHGVFGKSGSHLGEGPSEQILPNSASATAESGPSPPDIKVEVTPYPFIKTNDFELIEIDPDDDI